MTYIKLTGISKQKTKKSIPILVDRINWLELDLECIPTTTRTARFHRAELRALKHAVKLLSQVTMALDSTEGDKGSVELLSKNI